MSGKKENQLPNIIFIICDDLGINDLQCYGRRDHNTPNLDKLASEGVRFISAYASQAICSASRAGLLTGLNPARLHLTTYLPGRPDTDSQLVLQPEIAMNIPTSIKTLPLYFKEIGYITGFVGKWHIGKNPGPAEHGFDFVYYECDGKKTVPCETEGGKAEYELTREAMKFIKEYHKQQPFLLYLGHYTPHIPYSAKQHLIEKNKNAFEPVYAALIETLDDTVGLLLRQIEQLGLKDDTIFIFTSDNGGLHVPEGPHERVTHNTPFRAGKGFVYEGGQRVPLIIRWPNKIPAGKVITEPVNNTDWIPTLLELIGQSPPSNLDGVSFAEGLLGKKFPERPIFWHFPHYTNQGGRPSGAIRERNWLLIEIYDTDEVELYDLSKDISEKKDLSKEHPERVEKMRKKLAEWRMEIGAQMNRPNPNSNFRKFRELYIDVDPSKFDPLNASEKDWMTIHEWRKKMDEVYTKSD